MTKRMKRERRVAKDAIAAAKAARKEARRLAGSLPTGTPRRARIERVAEQAGAALRIARSERRRDPRRAFSLASLTALRLERSARGGTAARVGRVPIRRGRPVSMEDRLDALERTEARAKLIKRRRKQFDQAQKMAKFAAVHTIGQAITAPTDEERAESSRPGGRA
ncbi:hypothetical protein [Agromyces sp. LHK192]|uniref:hypothetical protein n=1 Tax=Agromyces sp. LHK192 TaxID=2498704 RepID=UPI000FD73E2A|nr:hypothetical protein [Agromyces sp. LHK192]